MFELSYFWRFCRYGFYRRRSDICISPNRISYIVISPKQQSLLPSWKSDALSQEKLQDKERCAKFEAWLKAEPCCPASLGVDTTHYLLSKRYSLMAQAMFGVHSLVNFNVVEPSDETINVETCVDSHSTDPLALNGRSSYQHHDRGHFAQFGLVY